MVRHGLVLATALVLTGCGAAASANYGRDARADALDAQDLPDVDTVGDTRQPVVDAPADVPRGHGPPYPIILHHGLAGFRDIGPLNYFYRVAEDLRARGEVVYESEVAPFLPPQNRAYELAALVDRVLAETGSAKVVIIGHSQGGLDPRYMISSLGYGDRVALLATIATPHRGTRIADAVMGNVPGLADDFINSIATVVGCVYNDTCDRAELRSTLSALTEAQTIEFNRANPDDPRVVYWSWAGRTRRNPGTIGCSGARIPNNPSQLDDPFVALAPFAAFLEQNDPEMHPNDGMVEVSSARWGVFMGCIPGDHFDEVGQIAHEGTQPSGFNHLDFYRDMVRRIHAAGF